MSATAQQKVALAQEIDRRNPLESTYSGALQLLPLKVSAFWLTPTATQKDPLVQETELRIAPVLSI